MLEITQAKGDSGSGLAARVEEADLDARVFGLTLDGDDSKVVQRHRFLNTIRVGQGWGGPALRVRQAGARRIVQRVVAVGSSSILHGGELAVVYVARDEDNSRRTRAANCPRGTAREPHG